MDKIENSGICDVENVRIEVVTDPELANLMSVMVTRSSDSVSPSVSPGTGMKGKGLRKWRRIKREVTKEGDLNVDSSKLLKRGLSNMGMQPGKAAQFSSQMGQISEGSISSSNEVVQNLDMLLDGYAMIDGSGLVMAPVFAAGAELENIEVSLSTTGHNPKMRDDRPVIAGHVHDRIRVKSSSVSIQNAHQGKTMGGTAKKLRGQISLEKQNSYSSLESDSRSSNVVLMPDNNSVTSRARQNGGLTYFDGEKGDQAHPQDSDQFQTSYGRNNGTEFEDVSQREMSAGSSQGGVEEHRENQESSTDQDPQIECINMLQSVQESLEKEVQKFREIGKEDILSNESKQSEWTYVNSEVNNQSSSGEDDGIHLHDLDSEISSLKENARLMKIKVEETTSLLKGKEAGISELEARLESSSTKEDKSSFFLGNHLVIGAELESIFRKKIEAEVKYLTISKTIQDLRVASVDKISILEQQIASDESQILNNLGHAESKLGQLRRGAENLDREHVCLDETVKLQGSLCNYTLCFLLQLMLLIVILGLLISQLSPPSAEVVPT